MAISDSQKVDLLFKKVGYGVSKTDTSAYKGPTGEANASPLVSPGGTIYQQDYAIPSGTILPTSNSSVVTVYRDSLTSTVQCAKLPTTSANVSWTTGLTDWIPVQYGTGYQVKLYAGPSGSSTPQNFISLPAGGSGNNDDWNFDYQAGVVNFADTNVPTAANQNGNVVYVVGARYTGIKGITTFANLQIGNISINGNTITGNTGVTFGGNITTNTVYGNIIGTSGTFSSNLTASNITGNLFGPTIDTINANILATNNTIATLQANVGAFELYANANIGTLYLGNISTNANLGAFELYANANIGTLYLGNISTNANLGAFQLYSNANAAVQSLSITSLATGANANTAAYLTTYTGNISAGNLFGNLYADTITSIHGNLSLATIGNGITVLNSTTALLLPKGNTVQRPVTSISGEIRFNTDTLVIEWFNGTTWSSLSNAIGYQQFNGDGTTKDFLLEYPGDQNSLLVNINGTMQFPGYAYTVNAGYITFAEAPLSTDHVDIRFIAVPLVSVLGGNIGGNSNISISTYTPPQALGIGDSPTFQNVTVTANVVAGNVYATAFYYANGTPFIGGGGTSSNYSNVNVAAYLSGNVTTGNVFSSGYYYANGMPFVGGTTYNSSNVRSYLSSFDGNIIPSANVTYSLGNSTHWWTEIWVDSNTIYVGGKPLSFNPSSNVVTYNNTVLGGLKYTEATVAPANPRVGDQWYDTDTDVLYEYLDTGIVNAWVDITGPVGVAGPGGLQGPQGSPGVDGNDGTSVIILGSAPTFEQLPTWGNLTYGEGFIVQSTGNLAVYDGSMFHDVGTIKGPKGDTGDIGIGVSTAVVIDGNLLVTLSNTYVINTGNVTGPQGLQGPAGTSATNYLNFGNLVANANLNMVTGTLSFTGYNGVVVGVTSNTANIGLAGNVTLTSVTSKFAEPVITGNIPSSYTPDWNTGSIHNYTAIQNFTLNAPINMPVGGAMTIVVTQDTNGSRSMTPNVYYKFASNIRTLSTGANSVDMMNFVRTGANTYLTVLTKGYA